MPGDPQKFTVVFERALGMPAMQSLFFHSTSNSLYFSDYTATIYKFSINRNETIKVAFGNGRGSQLNQTQLIQDLFVDIEGNIYVLDGVNARVLKWPVNATSGVLVAAGGGHGNGTSQLITFPIAAAQFSVDINKNTIYVLDTVNHRVQRYTIGSTNGVTVLGGNTSYFVYPRSMAIDGVGNILIGSNSYIKKYRPGDIFSDTIVTNASILDIRMNEPYALKFDRQGNLYTIDSQNGRIIKFAVTNSSCSSV